MKKIYILITSVLAYSANFAQNIGIGTTTPQSKLSIGASSQFQIDSVGNTKRINNIPIAFPSVQASDKQTIINDGAGNLSWGYGLIPSGGIILSTTLDSNIINAGFTLIGMKIDSIQPFTVTSSVWNTSINTVGAPSARTNHSVIWTGTEYIIWGGCNSSSGATSFGDGYRYNPATNTWTTISSVNAPSARDRHTAIWTGTEMIIWGGISNNLTQFNNGARYNPATNTWTTMSTINAPGARIQHSAVWTGTEMIIWGGGGSGYKNDGGRYNPITNTWSTNITTNNAPAARASHTAIWTGAEMIIWGGYNAGPTTYNDGKRYNPSTNSWGSITSTSGAPSGRAEHTAVWTGAEMIIWGGTNSSVYYNDCYRYNNSSNTWTIQTQIGTPSVRKGHSAAFGGNELFIWGGTNGTTTFNNGGRLSSGVGNGNNIAITYYYFRKN
jgi:N-acetylneuraminic acid mutarotase